MSFLQLWSDLIIFNAVQQLKESVGKLFLKILNVLSEKLFLYK